MNSDSIIQSRLQILAPEYQEYVLSDEIDTIANTLGQEEGLHESQIDILVNGYRLWLLFFFDRQALVEFISSDAEATLEIAERLVSGFFLVLPDGLKGIQLAAYTALSETQAPEALNLESEIKKAEEELESLHPIRTMAEDMQHAKKEESVHSSSQENLLQKDSDSSTPSNSSAPRWGSES